MCPRATPYSLPASPAADACVDCTPATHGAASACTSSHGTQACPSLAWTAWVDTGAEELANSCVIVMLEEQTWPVANLTCPDGGHLLTLREVRAGVCQGAGFRGGVHVGEAGVGEVGASVPLLIPSLIEPVGGGWETPPTLLRLVPQASKTGGLFVAAKGIATPGYLWLGGRRPSAGAPWSWVDGTPADNLNCAVLSCGLWDDGEPECVPRPPPSPPPPPP
jgi:hypothetical protein